MTQEATDALFKIQALRKLTEETGTITSRSERSILRALSDQAMIEVAQALAGGTVNPKPTLNRPEDRLATKIR